MQHKTKSTLRGCLLLMLLNLAVWASVILLVWKWVL